MLESSGLIQEAMSLRAQGERFEAAIAYVDAGRESLDLALRLLNDGYTEFAAEDLLRACECFLQAGDFLHAEDTLDHVKELIDQGVVDMGRQDLLEQYERTRKVALRFSRKYEKFVRTLQQLGEPLDPSKINEAELVKLCNEMPGLPALHHFRYQQADDAGDPSVATKHIDLARRLAPEVPDFWGLWMIRLFSQQQYQEAVQAAQAACAMFPNDGRVHRVASLVYIRSAQTKRTQRSMYYAQAVRSAEVALRDNRTVGRDRLSCLILKGYCHARLGDLEQSSDVLYAILQTFSGWSEEKPALSAFLAEFIHAIEETVARSQKNGRKIASGKRQIPLPTRAWSKGLQYVQAIPA